jgi:uncharacterized membrane protein
MTDALTGTESVIAVSFEDDNNAYAALTKLKELDAQGQVGVEEASVVVRDADGKVVEKTQSGSEPFVGTAGGGLIGLLVGVIGGPLGMLVGGATGLLVGSLYDLDEMDQTDSVLGEISKTVRPEHTAVLARVTEQTPEVVDLAMSQLGGTVLRRDVYDVEAELAAAEEAQREAKRQARKELRRARQEQHKAEAHAKVQELKAKLSGGEKAASTGA